MKDTERGRRDAPDPMLFAVVFDARLVAAKLFLSWDCCSQFVVGRFERLGNRSRAELRQIAARDGHLQHVFHPRFDR